MCCSFTRVKRRWGTVAAVCTVHGSKCVSHLATKRDLVFNLSLLLSQRESIPTLPHVHSVPKEAEADPGAPLWSLSAAIGSALIARLRSPRPAQRLWVCLIVEFLRASSGQLCRSPAYCFICFWKISTGNWRFESNSMAAASAPYAFRCSAPPLRNYYTHE